MRSKNSQFVHRFPRLLLAAAVSALALGTALSVTKMANAQQMKFSDVAGPGMNGSSVTGAIKSMATLDGRIEKVFEDIDISSQ
ncbi:hypothetical protein, partial [Thalassospira sp. CH_XMU1420-2]|uniref:hypothetical protein n=1 Tax=Thalassospira sp. CH_XMU1420-2 TaxID=3107769 RepID=UPI00300B4A63